MSVHVLRKDSNDGSEDYYKIGDAEEDDGSLKVYETANSKTKLLARYPLENVKQWRTS